MRRWVLFINVPLGIVLLIAALTVPLPAPARSGRVRLDVAGALSITLGMGALTYGLSQAASGGWGSARVVTGLAAAAVLLAGFLVIEATTSRPLIPLGLFRPRALRVGNLLMLAMGATMTAAFYFLSLYFQEAIGYSALRAGLALLPTTVVMIAGGLAARTLIRLTGPRPLLLAGGLITAAALAWLTLLPAADPSYAAQILGPALLAGIGMSLMLLPVTLSATAGIPAGDAGAAAGLLNSARQVGGAIGLAVLVNIAATATSHDRGAGPLTALVHGYHAAFGAVAAIMAVAALAALALPAARSAGATPKES